MDGSAAIRRVVEPFREARLSGNAAALVRELEWLRTVIDLRLADSRAHALPEPPDLSPEESPYGDVIERLRLGPAERLMLALALAPHVQPQVLDPLLSAETGNHRGRTELGGVQGRAHGGFLPTGETALFLLAGDDLRARFECQQLLDPHGDLARDRLVFVAEPPAGEPPACGLLLMPADIVSLFTTGSAQRPDFGREFPARLLESPMKWEELVLSPSTVEQLRELECWARQEGRLRRGSGLARRLRGGYRALFYGPPGTGKTVTAALLGQRVGRDVYRVMLSAVVSKYVGETAKNLERLFNRAEKLDCILFFDEADALFGKRAAVNDARDRYANQEVSYLLQRVEEFPGLVVLATNFEANLDEAFMRRFHAVVHFPVPGPTERRRLWQEALPAGCRVAADVSFDEIAEQFTMSGGSIVNALQYAALMALDGDGTLRKRDLLAGVRREQQKEGKTP